MMSLAWLAIAGIATSLLVSAGNVASNGDGGCHDSCQYADVCFPEGQTWTDSFSGCVQFRCLKSVDDKDKSNVYTVGAVGCPKEQPPSDGSPYINVTGDPNAAYPFCCSQIVVLQESKEKKADSSCA